MKQEFYCKKCDETFVVNKKEKYWNYKCEKCYSMCTPKNYIGVKFKGLPTIKR